ncbi:ORF158 [Xestia c-nigrum granulovirus]|uniref:ORF158 n=1 Tax=Xestia c-nigrum granulosis virus TaxID=51677 RepID=Q9PYN8_GVXN|nr:ORF158 [Xestia c-nigrum granulovirus]AAF05272.1 ORF158 [Xestia c-nigrum granulovirus]
MELKEPSPKRFKHSEESCCEDVNTTAHFRPTIKDVNSTLPTSQNDASPDSPWWLRNEEKYKQIRRNPVAALKAISTLDEACDYTYAFICENEDWYSFASALFDIDFGEVSLEERKNIKRCFDEIPSKYYDKTFGVPGVKMSMDLAKRLVN